MACKGSGLKVLKKDCHNILSKDAGWAVDRYSPKSREGWRTTCPECGKLCAVGPTSHAIQKHYPAKSKAKRQSAAEKKIVKRATHDLIYAEVYEAGLIGESTRPIGITDFETRQIWEMAYLDGLSDGGHNMKVGAFKRWLAKN